MGWQRLKRALPAVAGLAVGGAALAGAVSGTVEHVVRRLTAPKPAGPGLRLGFTPFETGVEWEDVRFPAADGTPLGGWLLTRDHQAPALLACGGYRARRSDLLGISSCLWRAGFTVLLFDYRGYGDEPGPVTLGYHELADAQAALRCLRERRPNARLGAIGFSMGAAIAIMLAAREASVEAVLADSPFSSQREIVHLHVGRSFRVHPWPPLQLLARLLLNLVERRLSRRFGFRFADVHPLQDVRQMGPRPLLLIHGTHDPIIPIDHTERVAAVARASAVPVETWFVPGAGHCGAYFLNRSMYCDRASTFLRRHLSSHWCQAHLEAPPTD